MVTMAVVLMIVALIVLLDFVQRDGWLGEVKHRWQMVRGTPSETPMTATLPQEK